MADWSKQVLGVFAKQPILHQAKTRLAAASSDEWARRAAQAFLEDSLDRFSKVDVTRVIAYTPVEARSYFEALAMERFNFVPQSEGELGRRLHDFFESQRGQGYTRIVVVGTDSPTLPLALVDQAFAALEVNDVVVVPAFDGGYCLIGGAARRIALFDGIPWSSPHVLAATVARVRAESARLALLPPWYDVDTADDWAMLCGHVGAMRLAGIDPEVPRVEALMREPIAAVANSRGDTSVKSQR